MNIETLKYRILYNWNITRMIRLALGLVILGMAVAYKSVALGLMAAVILFQVVTATGCCAGQSCRVPPGRHKKRKADVQDLSAK